MAGGGDYQLPPTGVLPGEARAVRAGPGDPGTHVLELHLDLSAFGDQADAVATLALIPIAEAINDFIRRRRAS